MTFEREDRSERAEHADASDLAGLNMFMSGYHPEELGDVLTNPGQLTPEELMERDGVHHPYNF